MMTSGFVQHAVQPEIGHAVGPGATGHQALLVLFVGERACLCVASCHADFALCKPCCHCKRSLAGAGEQGQRNGFR